MGFSVATVIAGGQTGADRGGLDAAIALGIPHGGWCPRGRRAEDGRIPDRYQLVETPTGDFRQRTQWNVRDADATLILTKTHGPLTGGTRLTAELARGGHAYPARPCVRHVIGIDPVRNLTAWLRSVKPINPGAVVLNVAGPRESKEPGLQAAVTALLTEVLR